jgi:hypothetical protein
MGRFDLHRAAREFADELSALLNATICTGIRLSSVIDGDAVKIGYMIGAQRQVSRGIPVTITKAPANLYLSLALRLEVDGSGRHLAVQSSVIGLGLDSDMTQELMHFDYERDKIGYPEAHLQINATSAYWQRAATKDPSRLHIPVGGRRYRPTLEEVVTFLIREGLATGHEGWEKAVVAGQAKFHDIQLRAAIRRNPESARKVLEEIDAEQQQSSPRKGRKRIRNR